MDTLPTEIISHIISFLDLRCQLELSAVSVRWRAAVSDCLRRRKRLDYRDLETCVPQRRLHAEDLARRCLTDGVLRALLPRLPALRALYVSSSELDLDIVSENCPHLEELDMHPFRLDPDSLERLCRRCPRLCDVRLPGSCSSDLLELLLRRLSGVRALTLSATHVPAAAVALLPAGLQRLELYVCNLDVRERQPDDRWPRLTELVLTHASSVSGSGLEALVAGCPRLQRLVLDGSDARDSLLELLPALPLHHLSLMGCVKLTEYGLVSCLGRLRQLRTLDLRFLCQTTNRVLDSLAGVGESLAQLTLGDDWKPVRFTTGALQRLVLASPCLRSVRVALEMEHIEPLVTGLAGQLGPDRDVSLAIPEWMLEELMEAVPPAETSSLRLVAFKGCAIPKRK